MRAIFAFDPTIEADRFVADCRAWGLDVAVLHPGFFADDRMTRALERAGLRLWLNVPVFFAPDYLQRHPEGYALTSSGRRAHHDWLHFVCPSDDAYLAELARQVRDVLHRVDPVVVSLDFIRHYVYWEGVPLAGPVSAVEDGCYCPRCLAAFAGALRGDRTTEALRPEGLDPQTLRGALRAEWAQWKCRRITEVAQALVAEVRQSAPAARLAVKTVPWRPADLEGAIRWAAGQDLPALAELVDLVVPMAFARILRQPLAWKRELAAQVQASTGRPGPTYVQVAAVAGEPEISPEDLAAELAAAAGDSEAGLVVFHYEQLLADPAKAEVLRAALAG